MIITKENYKDILVGKSQRISKAKKKLYTLPKDKWFKSIAEAIYCFKHDIEDEPHCICGESLGFIGTHKGYKIYCSNKCKESSVRDKYRGEIPNNLPELTLKDISSIISPSGKIRYSANYIFSIPKSLYWSKNLAEAAYCIRNNIKEPPKCKCGKPVSFIGNRNNEGYRRFCGPQCSNGDEITKDRRAKTLLKHYGVENASQVVTGLTNSKKYSSERYHLQGYLYIMRSKSNNMIKVGVSTNPRGRLGNLKKYWVDLELEFISCWISHVYMYEDFLHKKYGEYNMRLLEGDGRTEFFQEHILNDIKEDIKSLDIF